MSIATPGPPRPGEGRPGPKLAQDPVDPAGLRPDFSAGTALTIADARALGAEGTLRRETVGPRQGRFAVSENREVPTHHAQPWLRSLGKSLAVFIVFALPFLLIAVLILAESADQDRKEASFLMRIQEPITFIDGGTSNHDASWSIEVVDRTSRRFAIRFENGADTLVLEESDRGSTAMQLAMSGAGEKRLLAILERWAATDSEAETIRQQGQIHWESEGKAVAILIIRAMRGRN